MTIKYKTEGELILKNQISSVDPAAVKWLNGDDHIVIFQGSNRIALDKSMLQQLSNFAEVVADDIQPGMNSLPREA